ncbi:FecR family protein [Pedobacter nyackensis]|uniref:FecR family protein n=1 Tax=Pedobacter nyackensis TaxID=475255 RepID=UPI00292D496A|nr:FecR domain-containing protein [Pedobacter nyackensis]
MNTNRDKRRLNELAQKWKDGSITAQEQIEFNQWYDSFEDTLLDDVSTESVSELKSRLYSNILAQENIAVARAVKSFKLWYRIAAAAVILVVLSTGIYMIANPGKRETSNDALAKEDVKPGGNRALLTLADGTTIVIDDAADGKLAEQSGVIITKTKDGQLVYQFKDTESTGKGLVSQFNVISTPNGGQYQINLPDGTKVWLNAATSLKFPVTFSNLNERKVELSGEAYFEVFKDKKKPFKVSSVNQEVEVLGTHFNVNTYKNESSSKTTLLEGSVQLHSAAADTKLKPGEQAVLQGAAIEVNKVNTADVIAWKNGNFLFNDESLIAIMKQLERWYDVKVDYSTIPETHYDGFISKNVNLSEVLRRLEVTGNLKFKIENKTIKVYK